MIIDSILKAFALLRAFFYLYIVANSLLLAFLYWNAYRKYKMTPIIKAVYYLVLSIALNFFYMIIIALVSLVSREAIIYDWLVVFIPLFALPLMMALDNFRSQSTTTINDDGKLEKSYKLKTK